MGTYKLKKGFKPGAYGLKRVMLEARGNELPDRDAALFMDAGVIEPEGKPKAKAEKKAKPKASPKLRAARKK